MNQTVTQCPLHRQQTQLSKGSDGAELSAALCKYLNVRVGGKLLCLFVKAWDVSVGCRFQYFV